jgi:hypothetical protein
VLDELSAARNTALPASLALRCPTTPSFPISANVPTGTADQDVGEDMNYPIISADSHITEHPDTYRAFIDRACA